MNKRTIVMIVTLAWSAVLTGFLASPGISIMPTPGRTAAHAAPSSRPASPAPGEVAPGTLVMVIRHGEKPDDSTTGVDANGNEDDSSLTEIGWERAHRLVELFDQATGSTRLGLARPKSIYAAGANDNGRGQRTRETVRPLAEQLGVPVNTSFGKGEEKALVEHVLSQPGPTLIAWQHSEIPAIAEAFPSLTPNPPSEWPDDRFDVIWTLTKTSDGWQFAQIPELALPQDEVSVIKD